MSNPRIAVLMIAMLVTLAGSFIYAARGADAAPSKFAFVFISDARVATLKARVKQGIEPQKSAFEAMQKEMEPWLTKTPTVPASFVVPGLPDTKTSKTSGAVGTDSAKAYEQQSQVTQPLQESTAAAYQLALCYRVTDDKRYAQASARVIEAWIQGVAAWGRDPNTSLTVSTHFPGFVFAADLLQSSGWSSGGEEVFRTFLRVKALPLNTMQHGNNWGNWGVLFAMSTAVYLKDSLLFDRTVQRWKELLDGQLAEDGHLQHEVDRNYGKGDFGIWYSHFTLCPQTLAAEVARVNGVNLFDYQNRSSKGKKTLRDAYELLAKWTAKPETFPYCKSNPEKLFTPELWSQGMRITGYLEILNAHWPCEDAALILKQRRPINPHFGAAAMTFTHGDMLADEEK